MARSRDPDDILRSLASILGGVLARQDDTRMWLALRAFIGDGGIVLVEARRPTLSAHAGLAHAGIRELPVWTVSIDGTLVRVPPPLDGIGWSAADVAPPPTTGHVAPLTGIVALGSIQPDLSDTRSPIPAVPGHPSAGAILTRFTALHPSTTWFSTVERLVRDGRASVSADQSVVRERIIELIGR